MPESLTHTFTEAIWQQLAPQVPAAPLHLSGSGRYPSLFPVSELAQAVSGAVGRALSALLAERHGTLAPVYVDRRLASLWFGTTLQPHGWALPAAWDALAGDYPTADGWIRLHTNAPTTAGWWSSCSARPPIARHSPRAWPSGAKRSWKRRLSRPGAAPPGC